MRRRSTGVLLVLPALFFSVLLAQSTPQIIKLQGSLSQSGVGPVTGTVSMTFALHDAPTGGAALATVGPLVVIVSNGLYDVELPLSSSEFGGADRYVEITVNGEILSPRVRLGSVVFAYVADKVDGFEGADLEESAEIDQKVSAHEAAPDPHPAYVKKSGDAMTGNLQVLGVIESLIGGFMFPDGSTQTTAATGAGGSLSFGDLATGTNSTASMVIGSGASLSAAGTGTITATTAPDYLPLAGGTMTGNLQVLGVIESQVGGFMFPDGSTQTTAAAGGPPSFGNLTTGTNSTASMVIGSGASLSAAGTGTITATSAPRYLPLAGGTMTGPMTTKPSNVALVIPPGGLDYASSIEFRSQGTESITKGSWFMSNSSLLNGEGSEDHVLTWCYNCKYQVTGTGSTSIWRRQVSGEHAVRIGFESGFCGATCNPATAKGNFEFNIDIDSGLLGDPDFGFNNRKFFYFHDMDKGETQWSVGALSDPNSAYWEMGISGAGDFILAGNNAPTILMDRQQALALDPVEGSSPTSNLTQARIVLDPGGDFNGVGDRAVGISNLSGHLALESGIRPDGTTRQNIFLGYHRPTHVIVGSTQSNSARVSIDGAADQVQIAIQGHTSQTSNLMVLEKSDGTDSMVVSEAGLVTVAGGVEYTASDANPVCDPGNYTTYADLSEARMKLCNNGTRLDLPGFLQAGASIDFVAAPTQTCSGDFTISVPGSLDGSPCFVGPPAASVPADSQFTCWVSAAGTVTVRHCCNGASAECDPEPGQFRVTVIQ